MYCPKCATPLSDDQKFCRSCGLDLQVISQLLTNEPQAVEPAASEFQTSERTQDRKAQIQRQGIIILMFGLVVGCLIPISLGLLSNYGWLNQLILVLSGLAGLLLFAGCIRLIYADGVPETPVGSESYQLPAWQQAKQTNQLSSADRSASVPAVTEHTTDLLNPVKVEGSRKPT